MLMGKMNVKMISVVDALKMAGDFPDTLSLSTVKSAFENATVEAVAKHGVTIYAGQTEPEHLLYVPTGFLIAEDLGDGVLHYGIHISQWPPGIARLNSWALLRLPLCTADATAHMPYCRG